MNNKQLEARLEELVVAHCKLAARNEALMQVCKVMFSLIPGDAGTKSRLLTSIYDATSEHMEKTQFDEDMQQDVRKAIDELTRVILAGCK